MRLALLSLLLLASCAHEGRPYTERAELIEKRVKPLVGASLGLVVLELGEPDRVTEVGGIQIVHYGNYFGTFTAARVQGERVEQRYYSRDSVTLFLREGKVVDWEYTLAR